MQNEQLEFYFDEEKYLTTLYAGCSLICKGIPDPHPQLEFNFGELNEQK